MSSMRQEYHLLWRSLFCARCSASLCNTCGLMRKLMIRPSIPLIGGHLYFVVVVDAMLESVPLNPQEVVDDGGGGDL